MYYKVVENYGFHLLFEVTVFHYSDIILSIDPRSSDMLRSICGSNLFNRSAVTSHCRDSEIMTNSSTDAVSD